MLVRSGFVLLRDLTLYHPLTLSGKVCQLRQLSSPVFMPVKFAVSPPAGQNKPLPIEDIKAKAVAGIQTTPVNPFSKACAAKGTESDTDTILNFQG